MFYNILKKIPHLAIGLLLFSCATMPPKPPAHLEKGDYTYLKTYMTWFIQKQMKANDIVGLSIALVDDRSIVWQQGFGYADLKNKTVATPETLYRAGSISKVFNAMAAMKLVEAGKMDIDRPLVTYLPAFKIKSRFGPTDGITPRTIMTHHSGLPGDWIDRMWGKSPRPFTELVREIKDEYVAYAPNTILSYSNIGVTLLGHAIQNCSGQAYADYLDQSLLNPMGMTDSRFESGITGDQAAKSYGQGKEIIEYPLSGIPAGGLNTTATDLARLAMLVNQKGRIGNRQIISTASLDAMFTVQNEDVLLDLENPIGLAWFITSKLLAQQEPVYHHSGGVIAHRSTFMAAPESKLGVVVLANTDSSNTPIIAGKLLQMAWEAKTGEKLAKKKSQADNNAPAAKQCDFKGTFSTKLGMARFTEKSAGRYKVKSSLGNFTLKRDKDNQYHLSKRLWGIIPIGLDGLEEIALTTETISGRYVIIAQLGNNREVGGVRIEPYPVPSSWKNRLGQYELINPPEVEFWRLKGVELSLEDGYLVKSARYAGEQYTRILRPVNDTEAVEEGLGRGYGETVRVITDAGGKEMLTVSGLRFKRIEK